MLPPLELITSFFTESKIESVQEYVGPDMKDRLTKPENHENIDFRVQSMKSNGEPSDDNIWFCVLSVETVDTEDREDIPYKIKVTTVGSFLVSSSVEELKREEMVAKAGGSILYSATREHIAQITGRMVHGNYHIPTVSFQGISKVESKQE